MGDLAKTTVFLLTLCLLFMACDGGSRNPFKDPPLKDEMSFSYQETSEYKGRTMEKTIDIRFERRDDGMFDSIKTYTDKNGPWEQEPLKVDEYFKYNKVMDTLAGGASLWIDPKILASGNIGTMKIVEDTYNGKSVYVCLQGDRHSQYYDKETGFLEGYYLETDKVKETLVRIE